MRGVTMRSRLFVAIVGLVLGGISVAGAQGWVAGASVGQAKQYDYEVGGPIANTDETDQAFRVFGGYNFNGNLGVVVSYVDLGKADYDGPAFGGFTDTLKADGFDFSFVGGIAPGQQKKFGIFATAGFFKWKQDVSYRDSSGFYPYNDSGTSLSYGLGCELTLGEGAKWGVHFDYQMFKNVGDPDNSGHEYDRTMISVGVQYHFGR